jgi:hypothetical protein
MHGVAEGFHHGGVVGVDPLADHPRVLRGNDDVSGERTVRVDPEDAQVATDVGTPGAARRADPAGDVGLRGDERTRLHVVNLGAHGLDPPGNLVAERHRHSGDALVRPLVPLVDVQIGAADRGGVHTDEDLSLAGLGDRDLLEPGAPALRGLPQGSHRPHRRQRTRWYPDHTSAPIACIGT